MSTPYILWGPPGTTWQFTPLTRRATLPAWTHPERDLRAGPPPLSDAVVRDLEARILARNALDPVSISTPVWQTCPLCYDHDTDQPCPACDGSGMVRVLA